MTDKAYHWPNGKKGAVSFTYDDALPCHYEVVAPAWEAQGLQVTFYTHIKQLMDNPEAWREVAAKGHELGNHSIFHPCRKREDFGWLADDYDLRRYTPRRWTDEMTMANAILSSLDGRDGRSFGNNCCNTEIGDGDSLQSLEPLIEDLFVAGRGPLNSQVVEVSNLNLNALGHFSGDAESFESLRAQLDAAVAAGGWIIYMIHGVGEGTHGLNIDPGVHQKMVDHVGARQDSIWVAPLATIAQHLRDRPMQTDT
jgi:hypothetical protein